MNAPSTEKPKSSFVTVIGWIFAVMSGMMMFGAIMQVIMFAVMPMEKFQQAFELSDSQFEMPFIFRFMFKHMMLIAFASLVAGAAALIASVGLIKRMNWARILFIVLMAMAIAWTIGGQIYNQFFISSMVPTVAPSHSEFSTMFGTTILVIRIMNVIFSLAFCCLHGWIIFKLCSPAIKAEFVRQRPATAG